jgi:hypothetical protein
MLSAVLSNYRRWKHFFFSLISFCTSSVHHHVSLILRGHLVNTSRHLDSHIVRITLFLPRALLNDPLLERLSYLPFELPPLCSSNFGTPRFRYGASLRGLSPNEIILGFISVAYLEKKILGRGPLALHANVSNKWEAENANSIYPCFDVSFSPGLE